MCLGGIPSLNQNPGLFLAQGIDSRNRMDHGVLDMPPVPSPGPYPSSHWMVTLCSCLPCPKPSCFQETM